MGTIPVDVRAMGVDVYIGGCLKWLCGGPGAAFLWVDPELRDRLRPRLTGWMAHQQPFAFEPASGKTPRRLAISPWHAEHRGPLRRPARPGDHRPHRRLAIREKSLRQTTRLIEMAESQGWQCTTTPRPGAARGTVAIDLEHGYEISRSLKALDILCDYRPGAGIRLSPHFYTRDSELEEAMQAIAEIQRNGRLASLHRRPIRVT